MFYIEKNSAEIITWGGVFVLLIAGFVVLLPVLLQIVKRTSVLHSIKATGCDYLSDIVIPDGLGGNDYIEFIIRLRDRFCVLMLKKYQGVVFAADHIDYWTQVVKNRSYKFPNPLPELDAYIMSIKNIVPDVPVQGYLIALDGVDFPKGRPERLLPIASLKESFPDTCRHSPVLYDKEWQKLISSAAPADSKLNSVSSALNLNGFGWKRIVVAVTVFSLIIPWMYWRIMN